MSFKKIEEFSSFHYFIATLFSLSSTANAFVMDFISAVLCVTTTGNDESVDMASVVAPFSIPLLYDQQESKTKRMQFKEIVQKH